MDFKIAFRFLLCVLGFDGNRWRQRAGRLRRRGGCGFFECGSFSAPRAVDRLPVIVVLLPVKALVRNADELIRLLCILRKNCGAMIHADGNFKLEGLDHFCKNGFNAPAEGKSLLRVGLRQEQSELIATDAEGGVGSTQRFLKCGSGGAQNFVTARMAVLVVYFLETMKVQDDEAERLRVAPGAIQLFFEGFSEKPA